MYQPTNTFVFLRQADQGGGENNLLPSRSGIYLGKAVDDATPYYTR